ncbi:hypothetical protein KP509_01G079200 [Ceratopteris richardii]|nr:hypothetical protein KP509_01G079200 [Ceratopteris richardii]
MTHRRLLSGASPPATVPVSPSIVVIIIVLIVIFFLSAFLHLLIRWLARNPALIRRGLRAHRHGEHGSNNRIIALTALQGQLQQLFSVQDGGLDRSLIEELPVFSYKAAMGALKDGADCAICLCEFEGDDELRLLPSCGHAFHTDCIDTWLLSHSTCPLCRILLVPECWMPASLHPPFMMPGEHESTFGESRRQQRSVVEGTTSLQSASVLSHESSSQRSSVGRHITVIAAPTRGDGSLPRQAGETDREPEFDQADAGCASNPALGSSRRSWPSGSGSVGIGKSQNYMNRSEYPNKTETAAASVSSKHMAMEGNPSAPSNPIISSSVAVLLDSGHLSYTSLGNNTDVQSGRSSDLLDRASVYGSGRRVPLHLGKCRVVEDQSKGFRRPRGSKKRSYSKGSYEYVIDNSSNLEVLIPSPPKPSASVCSSRFNELPNLSHRISTSLAAETPTPISAAASSPRDSASKSTASPAWASGSFSKLKFCHGADTDACMEETIKIPLNSSQPSDMPPVDTGESSAATSLRANVGSDASFSSDSVARKVGCRSESGCHSNKQSESLDRAVSFQLPPPTHETLNVRLRSSASRRALSESEALSHWEPNFTAEEERGSYDGSHGQSSFAKRTMDWLVGWPRRMAQPASLSSR